MDKISTEKSSIAILTIALVIFISLVGIGIYYLYRYYFKKKPICPTGTIYDTSLKECIIVCPTGTRLVNGQCREVCDIQGYVKYPEYGNACGPECIGCGTITNISDQTGTYNLVCSCPDFTEYNPDTVDCALKHDYSFMTFDKTTCKVNCKDPNFIPNISLGKCVPNCSTGYTICGPSYDKCYQISTTDCLTGTVDQNGIVTSARGLSSCMEGNVCMDSNEMSDDSKRQVFDQLCRLNTCGPGNQYYPECATNPTGYIGYNWENKRCEIDRNCGVIPSSNVPYFPSNYAGCLVKQNVNNNCVDPDYSTLQSICERDSNGCLYGQSTGCNSSLTGCRPSNLNAKYVGNTCMTIEPLYNIIVNVSTVYPTSIQGTFMYSPGADTKSYNNYSWTYLVGRTDSFGNIIMNNPIIGNFQPTVATNCNMTTQTGDYCLNFNISLQPEQYLDCNSRYRIILYALDRIGSQYSAKYVSKSAEDINGSNIGDPVIVSNCVIPSTRRISLAPVLNPQTAQSIAQNRGQDVINAIGGTGAYDSLPVFNNVLPYVISPCTPDYCRTAGAGVGSKIIIVAMDLVSTTLNPGYNIYYYAKRYLISNRTTNRFNQEYVVFNQSNNTPPTGQSYMVINDLLPVNTTWVYEIGSFISNNPNDTWNNVFNTTPENASVLRNLTVDIAPYSQEQCLQVRLDPTFVPPFLIFNPEAGYCDNARTDFQNQQAYGDFACLITKGSTNNLDIIKGKQVDLTQLDNRGVYLWSGNGNTCSRVKPNLYPIITNKDDLFKVRGPIDYPNLSHYFGLGDDYAFTGINATVKFQCGATERTPRTGNDDYLQLGDSGDVITTNDLKNRLTSANTFAQNYIPQSRLKSWTGENQINDLVGSFYNCPTGAYLQNWLRPGNNCDSNDKDCLQYTQLMNCGQNYCGPVAEDTTIPDSYSFNLKYFPYISSQDGTERGSRYCYGNGVYQLNNRGTEEVEGSCSTCY